MLASLLLLWAAAAAAAALGEAPLRARLDQANNVDPRKELVATRQPLPRTAHLSRATVHAPPRSRLLSRLGNGVGNGSSIPAGGSVWPTAIYWTTVEIGTPARSYPAAIDSGSGDLDIGAKGCTGCVTTPPNLAYDPAASNTSKRTFPYVFSNTYETCDLKHPTAPCTIKGSLFTDRVSMAGFGPVEVTVGAIGHQTENFDQFKEIDGVVGFTQGGNEDVFAKLVANANVPNVWAICMHQGNVSNGTLTLGGVDGRLSDGPVAYVADVGRGFHSVSVKSFTLVAANDTFTTLPTDEEVRAGGKDVPVGRDAILDTGTNVLLLPPALLKSLGGAMCGGTTLTLCEELWSNSCVALTDAQVDAYPSLHIQLDEGVELRMKARDYLLLGSPLASSAGQYCLGIRSGGNLFIIGDTTMRNYYLVFDYANKRIGWGDVNTDTCGSIGAGEVAAAHAMSSAD